MSVCHQMNDVISCIWRAVQVAGGNWIPGNSVGQGVCLDLFYMVSHLPPVHRISNSWIEEVSRPSDEIDLYLLYMPSLEHQIWGNWALIPQTFVRSCHFSFSARERKDTIQPQNIQVIPAAQTAFTLPEAYMQCARLPETSCGALCTSSATECRESGKSSMF